jgi:hypothetical protein
VNGKLRDLTRMMKCWQGYCNVPIKSFYIELIASDFLQSWKHRYESEMYYDLMMRDFLKYLMGRKWTSIYLPGTSRFVNIGDAWYSRAETAHGRAEKACEYELDNMPATATIEWQKLFGYDFTL